MNRKMKGRHVTHNEVVLAMDSFLAKGGKITILPQQKVVSLTVIGQGKYEAYEYIHELSI
ncbi:MAG: hypothetical protein HQM12_11015 [SAR324 cluster bacterium]|nr:hypothetical protein [SAR324 cluster bacterium]